MMILCIPAKTEIYKNIVKCYPGDLPYQGPPAFAYASTRANRFERRKYLDPAKGWGGSGFYFLGSRATAYAKHPDDKAFLFDKDSLGL
jgi:hypothetical protein